MLLGALVDAGASLAACQAAVDAVMPDTVRLARSTVRRAGLRATKVDVVPLVEDLPHRRWTDIRGMIAAAALPQTVRDRAMAVFARLAEVEGRAHGIPAAEVHFHEIGAWDSIADIVGVCAALHDLGISRLTAGPVALGAGSVRSSHGELPVPVPAVLELSSGWRVRSGGSGELATPTGMALVAVLAEACEDLPELVVSAVGVGAGTRDPQDRANIVRVVIGVPDPADAQAEPGSAGGAVLIEANVDDLDPRAVAQRARGPLGGWGLGCVARPHPDEEGATGAHPLRAGGRDGRGEVCGAGSSNWCPRSACGNAQYASGRSTRTWRPVEIPGGTVRIKIGHRDGVITSATPEFEDVAEVARATGAPVRDALTSAVAAATTAGLLPGEGVPE